MVKELLLLLNATPLISSTLLGIIKEINGVLEKDCPLITLILLGITTLVIWVYWKAPKPIEIKLFGKTNEVIGVCAND